MNITGEFWDCKAYWFRIRLEMWGLEVCEEVGEHRGVGDKAALSVR